MDFITFFRHALAYTCYAGALAFVLALVLFLLRKPLHKLYERWRSLGPVSRCLSLVFVTGFVLYGGSKNLPSTETNDTENATADSLISSNDLETLSLMIPDLTETTGVSPVAVGAVSPTGTTGVSPVETFAPLQLTSSPLSLLSCASPLTNQPTTNYSETNYSSLSRWASRGAWCDWQRITLPEGFAFPIGTNEIDAVTVMSQGSLRLSLTNAEPIVSLPRRVSLEPGVSSVAYGLTASNSFVVAWSDVCVERDPTNRVDASIELFRNGDRIVRFGTNETFMAASIPEGFFGEGQDATWVATNFPAFAECIATNGYENWLNDYIGVNEANGRYQVKVTIATLPDGPCYLVCGPYRMVVKAAGTYCFPLEYFNEYTVRTYPEAVPLTFEYDDGLDLSGGWGTGSSSGVASSTLHANGAPAVHEYRITRFPEVFIKPNYVSLEEARGEVIQIMCKAANIESYDYTTLWGHAILYFTHPSDAVILVAQEQVEVDFILRSQGHEMHGLLTIGASEQTGTSMGTNSWENAESTNGVYDASSTNADGSVTSP